VDSVIRVATTSSGETVTKKPIAKKVSDKVKTDNEHGARRAIIEDLFYDFHQSRKEVYTMNFVRGIFFGLGSALGGTLVIALIIWLLSFFVQLPWVGDDIEQFQQSLQNTSGER
jgi:hypothetical protein